MGVVMFEILVYLFETYYTPKACPDADVLAHKLAAAGFEHEDIDEALSWLHGLAQATEQCLDLPFSAAGQGCRIYTEQEYQALGSPAIGFITFLEQSEALSPALREILIDRALATNESPIPLDQLKIIALMVLWSQQIEIDHLVFEELLVNDDSRPFH